MYPPLSDHERETIEARQFTACIICNSLYVDDVAEMLENGLTQIVVQAFLKTKLIDLTTQSISRHWHNHVLGDGTNPNPKQIQKGKILKAKRRANKSKLLKKKASKPSVKKKKSAKKLTKKAKSAAVKGRKNQKDPNLVMINNQRVIMSATQKSMTPVEKKRRFSYLNTLANMKKDINVMDEYVYVIAVSRDRVERALDEEAKSGLVLGTTATAISDYGKLLKMFKEATSGMESLTQLRFAQIVNMVGNVFTQTGISDKTRAELLAVMEKNDPDTEKINMLPMNIMEGDNGGTSVISIQKKKPSSDKA